MLALLLIAGGVAGAQFGIQFGGRLRAEQTLAPFALLVLPVCGKLAYGLVVAPSDLYSETFLQSGPADRVSLIDRFRD